MKRTGLIWSKKEFWSFLIKKLKWMKKTAQYGRTKVQVRLILECVSRLNISGLTKVGI